MRATFKVTINAYKSLYDLTIPQNPPPSQLADYHDSSSQSHMTHSLPNIGKRILLLLLLGLRLCLLSQTRTRILRKPDRSPRIHSLGRACACARSRSPYIRIRTRTHRRTLNPSSSAPSILFSSHAIPTPARTGSSSTPSSADLRSMLSLDLGLGRRAGRDTPAP